MAKRVSVDRWLFTVTMLLVFVGLIMVFSASAVMAKERFGSPYNFVLKQLFWALGGMLAMALAMKIDYRRYKNPAVVFSALAVTCLLLIAVFFLDRSHNTHRWIRMGAFSLQPSELAKPVLILFLAFFLETRTKLMDDWRGTLLPAVYESAEDLRAWRGKFETNLHQLTEDQVHLDLTYEAVPTLFSLAYQGYDDRAAQVPCCRWGLGRVRGGRPGRAEGGRQ